MGTCIHMSEKDRDVKPPNPNPAEFRILARDDVMGRSILLVKYEGCTTFGGKKLLLLRGLYDGGSYLDPHLLDDAGSVVARFEPNGTGWRLARMCAKMYDFR